jgi:hypothetical protein
VPVKIIGNILHIMKLEPKKGGDDFALFFKTRAACVPQGPTYGTRITKEDYTVFVVKNRLNRLGLIKIGSQTIPYYTHTPPPPR